MTRYLVDTSPLAAYLNNRRWAVAALRPWIANREAATSALVYAEVLEYLHQFIVGGTFYGGPDPEYADDMEVRNERRGKLSQIARREKAKFLYQYDFGDNWEHELLVEKIPPPEPGVQYPHCLAGKRACPPEDCGGTWGYEALLEALRDPHHPDHHDMREWAGEDFDPEAFDLNAVNQALQAIR